MAFPETLHVLAEWAVGFAAGAALISLKKRVERNPAYNWKFQVRHIAGALPWSFPIAPAAPLEFPHDASYRAFKRRQAREKRDDAVDRMGYELLQLPADVAASVVGIVERVPLMPVGSTQRSGEGMVRRDKFTADVERVAGTSFFDGWPMLNGASVGKFLEAIDHGKDGVIAKLREAMSSGSDYDPDVFYTCMLPRCFTYALESSNANATTGLSQRLVHAAGEQKVVLGKSGKKYYDFCISQDGAVYQAPSSVLWP